MVHLVQWARAVRAGTCNRPGAGPVSLARVSQTGSIAPPFIPYPRIHRPW